jgi:SMI1/KNR4 family protein SUKH-1
MKDNLTIRHQIERVKERLQLLPHSSSSDIEGCTDDEVEGLVQYANSSLPAAYQCFLEMMGHRAGHLFTGSLALLADKCHLRLRHEAERILIRAKCSYSLPSNVFVILMHQGYQFLFIPLDQGDDPPVYLVSDRDPYPKLLSDHFTSYLEKYVTELEHLAVKKPHFFGPRGESPDDND